MLTPADTAIVRVWRCRVTPPPPGVPHPFDAIVRTLLAPAARTPPDLLQFARGGRGKPRLARTPGVPDVRFNLSHSGEWLVVAVAMGREVGIDVQQVDPAAGPLDGIARFCAPAETALLDGHAADERRAALARLWAAKEAVLKATGEGIGPSVRRLDLAPAAQGREVIVRRPVPGDVVPRAWRVVPLEMGEGYAGALAVEGEAPVSVVPGGGPPAAG